MQVMVAFDNLHLLGGTPGLVVWRLLGFFTILTNLLIVLTMVARGFGRWPGNGPDERHVLFSLYWLIFAPKSGLRLSDAGRWMLYPAGYAAYARWRGGENAGA